MVRKVKVVEVSFDGAPTNIVEENEAPEESNITPIEEESNPTPDDAYVEPSTKSRLSLPADEPPVEPPVETSTSSRLSLPADETSAEPVVMKKKRSPPKAKAKAAAPGLEEEPRQSRALSQSDEPIPIQPEVEIPVEENKLPEIVPTKKPRAKAKPRAKVEPKPTHDADEVPPQGPAPPSRAPPMKYESPDEFWNNTIKNMKEKKKKQYEQLAAQAF
jgi:hypothetical protein